MQKNEMVEVSANLIVTALAQVVETIAAIIRFDIGVRVMAAVEAAVPLSVVPKRGPGRPKKVKDDFNELFSPDAPSVKKPRKKRAKQLCPVPGCKGLAAPFFGMVCKDHKDVAKSKIAAYRKQRKASKTSAKKAVVKKTSKKSVAKKTSAKKAGAKKTIAKKAVVKKTSKKSVVKKSSTKKVFPKKTSPKKASIKKISSKKDAPKEEGVKKAMESLADFLDSAENDDIPRG